MFFYFVKKWQRQRTRAIHSVMGKLCAFARFASIKAVADEWEQSNRPHPNAKIGHLL